MSAAVKLVFVRIKAANNASTPPYSFGESLFCLGTQIRGGTTVKITLPNVISTILDVPIVEPGGLPSEIELLPWCDE